MELGGEAGPLKREGHCGRVKVEQAAWVLIRKRFKVVSYLSGIAVGENRHDVMDRENIAAAGPCRTRPGTANPALDPGLRQRAEAGPPN